ncbi:hypothetical protein VTK26DRAFT_6591 [Humicola hyalothermophila]
MRIPLVLVKDGFTLSTLLVLGGLAQAIPCCSPPFPLRNPSTSLPTAARRGPYRAGYRLPRQVRHQVGHHPRPDVRPATESELQPAAVLPGFLVPVWLHPRRQERRRLPPRRPLTTNPLDPLAPGAKEYTDQFMACHKDLLKQAGGYGCLGSTMWRGSEAGSNNTILLVDYFRDMEGLHRLAHDPVHRRAWDWYNKTFVKQWGYSQFGIFHEAFCAPAGGYETIYIHMPPVLTGAGSVKVRNKVSGEDEWVRTLVDGSAPVFGSQFSRMGREVQKQEASN